MNGEKPGARDDSADGTDQEDEQDEEDEEEAKVESDLDGKDEGDGSPYIDGEGGEGDSDLEGKEEGNCSPDVDAEGGEGESKPDGKEEEEDGAVHIEGRKKGDSGLQRKEEGDRSADEGEVEKKEGGKNKVVENLKGERTEHNKELSVIDTLTFGNESDRKIVKKEVTNKKIENLTSLKHSNKACGTINSPFEDLRGGTIEVVEVDAEDIVSLGSRDTEGEEENEI